MDLGMQDTLRALADPTRREILNLLKHSSGLSYDIVMDMFRNLPRNGNFFSNKYWSDNIQKAQARS